MALLLSVLLQVASIYHFTHLTHFVHQRSLPIYKIQEAVANMSDSPLGLILVRLLNAQCSVCSSQTCDRHTEWRAAYVVQTCVVAELY